MLDMEQSGKTQSIFLSQKSENILYFAIFPNTLPTLNPEVLVPLNSNVFLTEACLWKLDSTDLLQELVKRNWFL